MGPYSWLLAIWRCTCFCQSVLICILDQSGCSFRFNLGHDSSISIVYPSGPTVLNIRISSLPFVSLIWTSEDALVAAGHDCQPMVFSGSEAGWQATGTLDDTSAPKSSGGASKLGPGGVGRLNSAAFNTFRNADSRGQGSSVSGSPSSDTELTTVHQNTITNVRPYEGQSGNVTKVSTSGVDGKLVIWNVSNVSGSAGLAPRLAGTHLR